MNSGSIAIKITGGQRRIEPVGVESSETGLVVYTDQGVVVMGSLHKASPVPLYFQLKQIIREQIEGGSLQPLDQLPSERELSLRYGISRMTVRQSLSELVNEGILYRRQGKGTFVALPKIDQGLLGLTGFTEEMTARGLRPESKLLSVERVDASPRVSEALSLSLDKRVIRLERLRLANGEPMALEVTHLPLRLFPGFTERDFTESVSLYQLMEIRYGIRLHRAQQVLEAGVAGLRESELLEVPLGAPLLVFERVTYSDHEVAVEVARAIYRGDRYKFTVELVRSPRKEEG